MEELGVVAMGIIFIAMLILSMIGLGFIFTDAEIQSKVRITPKLTITIKNGVADTSYLYKE